MDFDVIIIGASSSGLFAAQLLASKGLHVGLFEKQKRLNPERRTLIVTPEITKVLGPIPHSVLLHETSTMDVTVGTTSRIIRLNHADHIIERSELAHWLLECAREAGANVYFSHTFRGLNKNGDGLNVSVRNESEDSEDFSTNALIGADGLFSEVARAAGMNPPPHCPILQAEVDLPPNWDPKVTKVWFAVDQSKYFYWMIPESATRGIVGVVGDGRGDIRWVLDNFLQKNGLKADAYQGARVALHNPRLKPWIKLCESHVYLIGDAAGHVKVTTVGGTVTGLMAAEAVTRSILKKTSIRKEFGSLKRELDLQWGIRLLLDHLGDDGYSELIEALNPQVRKFLSRYNRDRMAPVIWRLFLQPRLIFIGLKSIFRIIRQRIFPDPSRKAFKGAKEPEQASGRTGRTGIRKNR